MSGSGGAAPARVVIRDAALIDGTGREPEGRLDVLVEDGRVRRLGAGLEVAPGVPVIDAAGTTLLPGLTDAHVHFALIGRKGDHGSDPWIVHVLQVARTIEEALAEGFTTVRDAGGLEPAWAAAVAAGRVRGPRILPAGSPLSQTGGHADDRARHEAAGHAHTIPGLVAGFEIVDGVDEVRRAAREQLRRGAAQLKLMASGGVISPTDPLHSLQLSTAEIAVAVEVARSWGTYVMAHCHTSPAVEMALDAGVRSIEHASILTPETAARMAAEGAFMVPTLQTMESFRRFPERMGLAEEKLALLDELTEQAYRSVGIARDAGVKLGSGSDVVGPWQGRRGEELVYKASVIGAHAAIISATRTNAELFMLDDQIGTVEVGKRADLLLVKGQPLDDVTLLAEPGNVPLVLKDGVVMKDGEARLG